MGDRFPENEKQRQLLVACVGLKLEVNIFVELYLPYMCIFCVRSNFICQRSARVGSWETVDVPGLGFGIGINS